jgi:hypothetical protein
MDPQDLDAIATRVAELVGKARTYGTQDPEVSLGQARKAAEAIARAVYAREVGEPGKMLLNELLQKLAAQKHIPPSIQIPFGTIQVYGNFGSHAQSDTRTIDADYVAPALSALSAVVTWFFEEYLKRPAPDALASAPAVEAPRKRRRIWPYFVGAAVVLVLAGGGFILATGERPHQPSPPAVTRAVADVPPVVAPTAPDATPEPVARNLELSYRVLVRSPADKEPRAIHSGDTVKTGDEMIFYLQPSRAAHCFVVQHNSQTQSVDVLFPNEAFKLANPLPADAWTRIPPEPHTITLDDNDLGTETVYLIASLHDLHDLSRALDAHRKAAAPKVVADQVMTIAMEKRSDCAGTPRRLVLDATGPCAVQPRGLVIDAPKTAPTGARAIRVQQDDDTVLVPFQFKHVGAK